MWHFLSTDIILYTYRTFEQTNAEPGHELTSKSVNPFRELMEHAPYLMVLHMTEQRHALAIPTLHASKSSIACRQVKRISFH